MSNKNVKNAQKTTEVKPTVFKFSQSNKKKVEQILNKYPKSGKHSAVMPLLWLAQEQDKSNHIPKSAMDHIAEILEMPPIKVYEVATFYTMYNKKPVGKHLIQVCRTTPCWLRGSDSITNACKKHLKINKNETTEDGNFTLMEVECLGACVNAPMVQINNDYYEDLDAVSMVELLKRLQNNQKIKPGSQIGRKCSAPSDD